MYHRRGKVRFFDMRRFFPEMVIKDVPSRDPEMAREMCPAYCCCFQFYDECYERATTEAGEAVEVNRKVVDIGPTYYMPPAAVVGLAEVRAMVARNPKTYSILLSNMEINGYESVVRTRTGNMVPFKIGDVVLEERS